ncbi:MAG: hypothetical protein KDK96_05830 [Chlamydiia bacterium]|nr:hypothetical protein [Chlamydiia bacterium]
MATTTLALRPFPHKTPEDTALFQDPHYCKWRVERNNHQLKTLHVQITTTVTSSYAFTDGKQLQDDPYKELFIDFFREMRAGARLVHYASWALAKAVCYQDITTIEYTHRDGGDYEDYTSTTYHIKEPFQKELEWLLHRCGGFNEQFLEVLRANSKKFIEGLSLKTRDTYFSSLPIFSRAFPRCYETLQSIFTDLLSCEWLQDDIYGIQEYTAERTKPESLTLNIDTWMLWKDAIQKGIFQQLRDEQIAKQHEKAWQSDKDGLLVAGGLSYGTGSPIFIGGQLMRMFFNAIARNTDPEGEDFFVQALPTLAATGIGGIGGVSKELVARLAFDLVDLHSRHQSRLVGAPPSRSEETARNIAITFIKALLTQTIHGDDEKYLKEILGGLLSEAMSQIPEADETTPWGRRVLRVALTSPDVQGEFINRLFDPTPPEQVAPEERTDPKVAEETKQEDPEPSTLASEEDVAPPSHEPLRHEEDLAPLTPPELPTIQPPTSSLSLRTDTQKTCGKKKKEYLVYLDNGQGHSKQIGKFSSKASAQSFQDKYRDYIDRLNKRNQEIAQTQAHYHAQGVPPAIVAELSFADPIYVEISACGSKSNVYQGDTKVPTNGSRDDAIEKAFKLMDDHIAGITKGIHDHKTKMADQIFTSPSTPHPVKLREVERLVQDQRREARDLEQVQQKTEDIETVLMPDAERKVYKRLKEADDDILISGRKERRYKEARTKLKLLKIDQSSTSETEKQTQKRIEDNNFTLQIAQGNTTREEVTQVQQEHQRTKGAARSAASHLREQSETFQKTKKDKDHQKVRSATKSVNQTARAETEATNRYYQLQGVDYQASAPPEVKAPPKATAGEKTMAWIKNNVSCSGEVNVVTVSGPSTPAPPTLIHVTTDTPPNPKPTTYTEGRHQVHLESSELQAPQRSPTITTTFQDVQSFQRQQQFEANMAFTSAPPPARPTPEIDWGRGVARSVQPPPVDMHQVRQSGITPPRMPKPNPIITFSKKTQEKVNIWVRDFIKEWKDDPLKARTNLDVAVILGAKKATVIFIEAFQQPTLKDRSNTLGLMDVSDNFDRWVAGKLNVDLDSRSSQLGMFVGEFCAPMGLAGKSKPAMKVGQEAIQFLRSTPRAKPLLDRVLQVHPEKFSRELRAIEKLQRPAYHSGIGSPWSEIVPTQQVQRSSAVAERALTQIQPRAIQASKSINRSNNHQFVTWIERGQTRTTSLGDMSHAGTFHDRGGLTKAGRSLEKKAGRIDSVFPKPSGNVHEVNMQGQRILDEILNHPDKQVFFKKVKTQNYRECIDIRLPDGRGARFTKDGREMIGFLEPKR